MAPRGECPSGSDSRIHRHLGFPLLLVSKAAEEIIEVARGVCFINMSLGLGNDPRKPPQQVR